MIDIFEVFAPEIHTARLSLRRLTLDDAPAIYAYASDPEVAQFTLWTAHTDEDFTRKFLTDLTQPTVLSWAIVWRESTEVVGMVFFHSLNRRHGRAELAFNLARRFWKRGIATEAATAVLEFAFQQLMLNRVEATCMRNDLGSRRVLEKLGMTHEGVMRQSHRRHDGFHDMDLFSLLRDERGNRIGLSDENAPRPSSEERNPR